MLPPAILSYWLSSWLLAAVSLSVIQCLLPARLLLSLLLLLLLLRLLLLLLAADVLVVLRGGGLSAVGSLLRQFSAVRTKCGVMTRGVT